ncbi:hypothetical protein P153DRAFT_37216 [Dothidotthia symphoricarpi CBS 119687]|uniref:Uncharacterized protein n=1 Tax=Dothidotthia symphoricarpi CBS 119687 TaxID=1392245 RepID=A0A6A6AB93_9PLEO|nr:uncharacterized protein P153DRAFT_37216 [Dothidotthia symphoricarpi CBS 119687]KAF2128425.1 hypothetical protein P153DRAFT_37216 [Dothidotthia symphoricarpi CBS 119687]
MEHQGAISLASPSDPRQLAVEGEHALRTNPDHDPQLFSFSLTRTTNIKSWEKIQSNENLRDLQDIVRRFRVNRGNVKHTLNIIPSSNCRRIIYESVEKQNLELWYVIQYSGVPGTRRTCIVLFSELC